MGLRIIYGRAGTGKTQFCFEEIAKLVEKEKKIYIITPEQFSFTAEQKLIQSIKTNAVVNAEVITLSRMAYRVANEIGTMQKTVLSKAGKAMLIYNILDSNKKKLNFLGKSDENIDVLIDTITDFKKHGIKPEDIQKEISQVENTTQLKYKLQDVELIYNSFENQIKEKYIDETDLLTNLYNGLEQSDIVKDSIIYIDEFLGFTTQEYKIIEKLIKLSKQVNITFCIDDTNLNTDPNKDIFYSNKQTLSKILNIAKNNRFDLEEEIKLKKEYRFKNEELKHLEANIYNNKYTIYDKNVENINLFLSQNQYLEIENVASKIYELVKQNKSRYNEISIITKNLEKYSSLVRAIFNKYEIPVFIDEKRELNQNIIIQYFLSIIEILSQNFSTESIFNYLNLGFTNLEKDEIFKLELYVKKWGINRTKWIKEFTYGKNENNKKEIERLEELRKHIINPLLQLKENIDNKKNVKEISIALYDFLILQNIQDKIVEKINTLKEKGLIDLANEYKSSYDIIIELLDQLVLIFNDDKTTLSQYIQLFKVGLKNSGLGKIPGTKDQVIFGDVERSRTHKMKYIFIIGLNDGEFPGTNKDEGFLNDDDRTILKTDGLEIAKGTIEKIYEENFNIYRAFTTAENKLYMSYSSSNIEGNSLRPSILIMKLKRIFPNLIETSDITNKSYSISNLKVTYEQLLQNINKLKSKENIDDIWYLLYQYYKNKNEWNEKLQKDLQGLEYSNLPQPIKQENIQKLYGNTLSTSVSKLERFRSCPFSYYLQYGLKIKLGEELKIRALDTGSFMHAILDEFFERVKENNIELPTLIEDESNEKIYNMVLQIVEEKLQLPQNYIFTATAKYIALVNRLKRIITKALRYIIEGLVHSDFNIAGTEIGFGKGEKYSPILLNLEDGRKVEITGKIDRIDTAKNEDGKYLRIIDYKSSAKEVDLNEVYAGLQIQILTYMDAICKEEDLMPAGVLYFGLLEQMVKSTNKITKEEIENQIRKNFKMKGLILADVKVIKMQDNTLEKGTSNIIQAGITTSGEINKRSTNGVNKEEFETLQNYIYKTIKEISKEILKGKTDLSPYNKKGKTPCAYCEYKSICGFDTKNKNNKYNYISKKTNDEIINLMKKENGMK